MKRFIRSVPRLLVRAGLSLVAVAVSGLWGASHRWILERHWVDLTTFPDPMGWVIVWNGTVYWGGSNGGYAIGGFGRTAVVQWHAWDHTTPIAIPAIKGQFSMLAPTVCLTVPALAVWVIPFAQDWNRRRRGRCECGYDLRGLPKGSRCPECGESPEASRPRQSGSAPSHP